MNAQSVQKILTLVENQDLVLDVGGWAQPFPRADYVIDIMPYETRGLLGRVYEGKEQFSNETWITRDLCDRAPFPFPDRHFDFAICAHVLEDVKDPLFVCSELQRVAKRGYIETPSRLVEQTVGVESRHYCGYHHHRWLVDLEDGKLLFTMKSDLLMHSWRFHLPKRYLRSRPEGAKIVQLFWEDGFEFGENILITFQEEADYLENFVLQSGAYSSIRYWMFETVRRVTHIGLPCLNGSKNHEVFSVSREDIS